MIFVTVGMEKFPFDRLLKAIDEGIKADCLNENVFAQTGNSRYAPELFKWSRFLTFNEMVEHIQKANIVVAHAGVGSTLLSLSLGKFPIIFPRSAKLGEHLDDHQIEFAKQMEKERKSLVAHDSRDLLEKINNYKDHISMLRDTSATTGKNDLLSFLNGIIGVK